MSKPKNNSGNNKPKHEHNVIVSGSLSVHTPVEEQKQHRTERQEDATQRSTERQEDRGRETAKIWLEGLTLIAVVFYSGITTWQGCMLKESITNNTKQFREEQRPYISVQDFAVTDGHHSIEDTNIGFGFEKGKPLSINIGIKNTGKTTALNVITHRHVLFGQNASQIRAETPDENRNGTTVDAGTEQGVTAISLADTYKYEAQMIDPNDIIPWDGSQPVFVFGRVTYFDREGVLYCSPFLMKRIENNWMRINELHNAGIRTMSELCPHGEQ